MAPEILNGEEYDRMVDYWSLGVALHSLVTLQHPFWDGAVVPTVDILKNSIAQGPSFIGNIDYNLKVNIIRVVLCDLSNNSMFRI